MRVVDLRQKEVINICTCKTLGCPIDVEFNPKTGHLTGLVLPGPVKFCGFFCLSKFRKKRKSSPDQRI